MTLIMVGEIPDKNLALRCYYWGFYFLKSRQISKPLTGGSPVVTNHPLLQSVDNFFL